MTTGQQILGAFLLTYFVSRLARRVLPRRDSLIAVLIAHIVSFAVICLAIVALRYPTDTFAMKQLRVYVAPQIAWFLLDWARFRAGGGRAVSRG